jgi:hypothetical protein
MGAILLGIACLLMAQVAGEKQTAGVLPATE